jgi:RTX calcium-binding nonapeptide repeat (4 copies)
MTTKARVVGVASIIGALSFCISANALADTACRTSEDSTNAVLHLHNFTPPASGTVVVRMGQFNFFGVSTVGACVTNNGSSTLYVVVDASNHLLGWLPKTFNHLCLTDRPDDTMVLQTTATHCSTTMSPLNYNGNILVQYGQASNDVLRGGNGIDILYGGLANDSITDYFVTGANGTYYGELYGESGNDVLLGSPGDSTHLDGGIGNDNLRDFGGNTDTLFGNSGNECCMWDSNNTYSGFDCGTGSADRVHDLSGNFPKTGCEIVDTQCNINFGSFCL